MQFANRTHLLLEPGLSAPFSVAGTGAAYETAEPLRETLNDLSRLQYLKGSLKYALTFDAAESAAVITVQLKNGANVIGEETVSADGDTAYGGRFAVDLSELNGTDALSVTVVVDTAASVAATATIGGVLDVEHPIVFS
mgnify:CR=1 FL=1